MRQGARSFIFAAAWGAALPACSGVGLEGLGPDPVEGGARATGATSSDGGLGARDGDPPQVVADASVFDSGWLEAANDGSPEAAPSDAPGSPPEDVQAPDAPTVGTTDCDLDGDGYRAAGDPCGGDDCCDSDADAHPDQTGFFTQADRCNSFDYDCSGTLTLQYGQVSCGLDPSGCSGDGFAQPQSCGATALFEQCDLVGLVCVWAPTSMTQGCR
jgi:hypothetical protein